MKIQYNGMRPTEGELEILSIIWEKGEASVKDIHEAIAAYKKTGYTTTLKLLQLMFEKGIVARREIGRKHIYRSSVDKNALEEKVIDRLIGHLFEGSPAKMAIKALSTSLFISTKADLLRLQEITNAMLAKQID
ncbi:MAG: BlaI/MecI/CopY family transcriptional regulator [Chitinophagaceae bacterium]